MLAANRYNPFDNSFKNARILSAIDHAYMAVKNFIGRIAVVFFISIIILPFIYIGGLWLYSQRKRFEKTMKKDMGRFTNVDEWVADELDK